MGSSLASNLTPALSKLYHIDSDAVLLLPTSLFLVGYVVGPLVWGPLSEHSGRRPVLIGAFALFLAATLGCAAAPTYAALNILRFFAGAAASCPITVCGGVCADLYRDSRARGRAMAIFMCFSMSGPSMAPAMAGFVEAAGGWRLVFWISLALAVTSAVPLAFLPETYGPVLLAKRVKRARRREADAAKAAGESAEAVAAILSGPARAGPDGGVRHVLTVVLMRPLRMLATEPLVLFSCMYLSFAYSIFYMFLPAFPMVFQTEYGFSLGEEGLTFLGFGLGSVLAVAAYYAWDAVVARAARKGKRWAHGPEGIRLPLACAGGPLVVAACFWLGWTARSDIPWEVPVMAMVPFGIGFLLLFMALLNYLVDAYKIFAASAIAAAGTTRSVCGAALPFAAQPMYNKLGVPWACSLLGFLSLGLAVIPFVFMWKGEELRLRSNFCRHLREYELQEEEEKRIVHPSTDATV
jgi:multidrug resistance protein